MSAQKPFSIVLVIRPDNFRIDYVINENMAEGSRVYAENPAAFRKAAQEKSRRMVSSKRGVGVAVLELRGHPRHSDAVFIRDVMTNAGSRSNLMVTGRMASRQRQGEFESVLPYLNPRLVVKLHSILEGGDFRPTPFRNEQGKRVVFIGCGPRTAEESVKALQGLGGLFPDIRFETLALSAQAFEGNEANLGKADFFHGDTCLYIMNNGAVAVYREGLKDEAWAKIEAFKNQMPKDDPIYYMTREEAEAFACNIKSNGDILITTSISASFKTWLEKQGAHVLPHDLEEFRLAGGGPNCLTNEIHDITQLSALGLRTLIQQNPKLRSVIVAEMNKAIREKRLPTSMKRDVLDAKGPFRPRTVPLRTAHTQLRRVI